MGTEWRDKHAFLRNSWLAGRQWRRWWHRTHLRKVRGRGTLWLRKRWHPRKIISYKFSRFITKKACFERVWRPWQKEGVLLTSVIWMPINSICSMIEAALALPSSLICKGWLWPSPWDFSKVSIASMSLRLILRTYVINLFGQQTRWTYHERVESSPHDSKGSAAEDECRSDRGDKVIRSFTCETLLKNHRCWHDLGFENVVFVIF